MEYARAFWERYEEITNFEGIIGLLPQSHMSPLRLVAQIERGELKIKRRQEIQLALDVKVVSRTESGK
jgi:hypothetical protein